MSVLAAASLPAAAFVAFPAAVPAVAAVDNPLVAESCGIDVSLVLDASGSISNNTEDPTQGNVSDVRNAAGAFLDSLRNTDSTARVTQFGTVAGVLAPTTGVDDVSLGPGGALRDALEGYYNPQPPIPPGVTVFEGSPPKPASGRLNQYTNWDQGLRTARESPAANPELVVFLTDGDPTAYDLDQPGDPGSPAGPDVLRGSSSTGEFLTRAVEEADALKSDGVRVLTVGVGAALQKQASVDRLIDISGPQVVGDSSFADTPLSEVDSINEIDVALVTDFADLAELLRGIVLELCSPSLTITKLSQSPDDASFQPAQGWDITVEPFSPAASNSRSYDWVLPDTTPANTKTVTTQANGTAQFQWEPIPGENDSRAVVTETLQPGYLAGRPGSDDFRCEKRDETGNVTVITGEIDQGTLEFEVDPIGNEIVTCLLWNAFDYQPAIDLTKVNNPTELRGDLSPPATVTSTYVATNPGNTPLSSVSLSDDRCGDIQPSSGAANPGDTNGNGLLDPLADPTDPTSGENWEYTCQRGIVTPASTDPAGRTIVNVASVTGTDPVGTVVDAQADDDVDAFNPAISLTKLVDGEKQVTVPQGQQVSYTYAVSNSGNTPLGSVDLVDDTPPCQSPTRGADDPGNNDDVLDVAETWSYSCVANPTAAVVNTADVTADPLNPLDDNQPFLTPNPPVTDTDTAAVDVVNPDISLAKSVDPAVVLIGPNGDPEPVTYTFVATNPGDAPLGRPGADAGGPGTKDPGWVADPNCFPVEYVDGDTNSNDLLDSGEPWQFTCSTSVTSRVVNTATIVGQPTDEAGVPLPGVGPVSDRATAVVDVVRPGIDITKTSLRPVVLDPDAAPVDGPDVPRLPARYEYEVVNTGNVPLALDPDPPTDDICSPLLFTGGDVNGDSRLDTGEVWTYTCEQFLDRDQSNVGPPPGNLSAFVRNEVTANGVPFFDGALVPDKSVSATSDESVLVIEPALSITKTASEDVVRPGTEVTYTFVVSNDGDVGLRLIGPDDSKCAPLVFVDGDRNNNGLLDGANSAFAEQWTYTCTRTIGLPPEGTEDVNQVLVGGLDPLGNRYIADDTATVRVIDPAIALTKTVSDTLVPVGTDVTYGFEVTNVGQSPIAVDDVLDSVTLVDASSPAQPSCESPTLVEKVGGNQDDLLDRDPAETWVYTCAATIDQPTTNLAVVGGIGGTPFELRIPVLAADVAFVQTFDPGIDVVKTADPTTLLGSGEVTYTYEVTNTGDVPLSGVAERITDDTCSPVTYVSGDEDADNLLDTPTSIFEDALDETWLFTCNTTVSETTTNVVETPGTPTDPGGQPLCQVEEVGAAATCDVTDTDTATVTVVNPATNVVTKVTEPESSQQFDFTFAGSPFTVSDGESQTFDNLVPGTYIVEESVPAGWTLTDLTCDDATADTSTSDGQAVVDLDPGEVVTCTYTNTFVPTPEKPQPPLPVTGASSLGLMLAAAAALIAAGLTLARITTRSRQG